MAAPPAVPSRCPPGFVHQVKNLEDCMKAACDFVEPERLHLHMQRSIDIGSGQVRSSANDDVALTQVFEAGSRSRPCGVLTCLTWMA